MRSQLTKRTLDALRPEPGRDVVVWDAELRRFGVRVTPSGATSFIVQYRNAYGRSRRKTLGQYPPLTVQEARAIARDALAEVAKGIDPAEEKRKALSIPTVKQLGERYLAEHVKVHCKPKTEREAESAIEKHLVPAVGHLAVTDVKRADLGKLHFRMRKTPVLANRVLKVASALFSFAEREGIVGRPEDNPARGIQKYKEAKRDRFLSPAEYQRLGTALADLERDREVSTAAASAIRFLALSGLRVGEVLALEWSNVDLGGARITLRDSKTGPRQVVISVPARDVLASIAERLARGTWVFPGRVPGQPLVNIAKPWELIRTKAELAGVRLHDLRHSFASVGVASHMGLPIVGALLGHAQPATTARYAHVSEGPLRLAADGIGEEIAASMRGGPSGAS